MAVGILLPDDVPATQLHVPVVVCLDVGVHRPHPAGLEIKVWLSESFNNIATPFHY